MININRNIANIPIPAATNAQVKALVPSVGLIFSSCISTNGAGNAPSLSASTSSLAESGVNHPSI
jgi:hypothetical protein